MIRFIVRASVNGMYQYLSMRISGFYHYTSDRSAAAVFTNHKEANRAMTQCLFDIEEKPAKVSVVEI